MGSRYDIVILHAARLDQVREAIADRWVVGDQVGGPWQDAGTSIAEAPSSAGVSVVVASPPMDTPRGIDVRLARRLGVEAMFATVRDSVGLYELQVVGPGLDRSRSLDGEHDESSERGTPLPEEPLEWPFDEAYVQRVCTLRYGIDPGTLAAVGASWRALVPAAG